MEEIQYSGTILLQIFQTNYRKNFLFQILLSIKHI